jgi:hypothetical protein
MDGVIEAVGKMTFFKDIWDSNREQGKMVLIWIRGYSAFTVNACP